MRDVQERLERLISEADPESRRLWSLLGEVYLAIEWLTACRAVERGAFVFSTDAEEAGGKVCTFAAAAEELRFVSGRSHESTRGGVAP